MANVLLHLPELQGMELNHIQLIIKDFSDKQAQSFAMIYRARRRDPQIILLTSLVGFLGFAGIHRFLVNQIGMGILYFFTAGLCFIGTIVDAVNYQNIAFEYNRQIAGEVAPLVKSINE
ncbi:MAG: TM2 domain-containing protein [Lentimicrobium sp.]|jgi:TM2 domain-containing membrane protein YozV|nr:TM2 domain-containing protein [Lentimicrobium sp.]